MNKPVKEPDIRTALDTRARVELEQRAWRFVGADGAEQGKRMSGEGDNR